jgi:hypothetical protein
VGSVYGVVQRVGGLVFGLQKRPDGHRLGPAHHVVDGVPRGVHPGVAERLLQGAVNKIIVVHRRPGHVEDNELSRCVEVGHEACKVIYLHMVNRVGLCT